MGRRVEVRRLTSFACNVNPQQIIEGKSMYMYRYTVQWSGEDCRYTAEFRHIEDALDYWHSKSNAQLEWLHTNEEEE